MKGIAHFTIGVAVASCFPQAVREGMAGNPLLFVLGGVCGLLPDTLDFKFVRYFARHDIEVTPDPLRPDPQQIADAVALAMRQALESERAASIKLNTIRLGVDHWQQYEVRFDAAKRKVQVRLGPVVNTGRNPVEGTSSPGRVRKGEAKLPCRIRLDYEASVTIDIFDGPLFRMDVQDGKVVVPRFIPWHRQWSHSLAAAAVAAVACGGLFGWAAGAVAGLALAAHGLTDHLGFMGTNLLYPFRRNRQEGWKLLHSDETAPNFWSVWFSCLLIFWNLYAGLGWTARSFNILQLFFFGALLPWVGWKMLAAVQRRRCGTGWFS